MSFVLYAVVVVVSVTSVMMGLDWLSTPPPAVPKSVQTVRAPAKPVAPARQAAAAKTESGKSRPGPAASTTGAAPPAAAETGDAAKSALAKSDASDEPAAVTAKQPDTGMTAHDTAGRAPAGPVEDPQASGADGTLGITTNEGEVSSATVEAPAPRCDVQACEQRYISFDASDCTYQPFDGPRRLCTAGNPPARANGTSPAVQTSDATGQPASSSCNYNVCGAAYRSFDPATCTWQPYEGPRRRCTK